MKTKCNKQLLKQLRIKTTYLLKTLLTPSNHHIYFNEFEPQRKPESIILSLQARRSRLCKLKNLKMKILQKHQKMMSFFLISKKVQHLSNRKNNHFPNKEFKDSKDSRDKKESNKNVICFEWRELGHFINEYLKLEKKIFKRNVSKGKKKRLMCT